MSTETDKKLPQQVGWQAYKDGVEPSGQQEESTKQVVDNSNTETEETAGGQAVAEQPQLTAGQGSESNANNGTGTTPPNLFENYAQQRLKQNQYTPNLFANTGNNGNSKNNGNNDGGFTAPTYQPFDMDLDHYNTGKYQEEYLENNPEPDEKQTKKQRRRLRIAETIDHLGNSFSGLLNYVATTKGAPSAKFDAERQAKQREYYEKQRQLLKERKENFLSGLAKAKEQDQEYAKWLRDKAYTADKDAKAYALDKQKADAYTNYYGARADKAEADTALAEAKLTEQDIKNANLPEKLEAESLKLLNQGKAAEAQAKLNEYKANGGASIVTHVSSGGGRSGGSGQRLHLLGKDYTSTKAWEQAIEENWPKGKAWPTIETKTRDNEGKERVNTKRNYAAAAAELNKGTGRSNAPSASKNTATQGMR